MKKKLKVALVYDRVNKWGGAERVLLALHEIFPNAPLYTSVYNPKGAPWAKVFPRIKTSFLQKISFARSNHEFFAPLMPFAFASFDFSKFDLVISVTSEAAKGIKTKGKTIHICYCLTPTRYLWSGYKTYFKKSAFKYIAKPVVVALQMWDKYAAGRPDHIISISSEVKKRVKKYYGRDSEIIFPPVNIPANKKDSKKPKEYFLVISRLVSYKKVDLAIRAFNKLKEPLLIIGTGREEGSLKKLAGKNIQFAGEVSEKALSQYYLGAKALIMPQEEDFGIVAVEAQSYGVPVIAYKKGGSLDTVIPGKTGIFFDKQNKESIIKAVKEFEKKKFDHKIIINNSKRFTKAIFKKELLALIKRHKIQ